MSEWISVDDIMPEDDVDVLITWGGEVVISYRSHLIWHRDDYDEWYGVTHWQPLPPPP